MMCQTPDFFGFQCVKLPGVSVSEELIRQFEKIKPLAPVFFNEIV